MKLKKILSSPLKNHGVNMKARQQPLMDDYRQHPERAIVLDHAQTHSDWMDANNSLATAVKFDKCDFSTEAGVHTAVGGDSDTPTPGDILCGAIASCLDSTIRIIANRFNLSLKKLSVKVTGKVDVRGTLRIDTKVPVAFQSFKIVVDIKPKGFIPAKYIDRLLIAAEHSCIIIQSLNGNCEISIVRGSNYS